MNGLFVLVTCFSATHQPLIAELATEMCILIHIPVKLLKLLFYSLFHLCQPKFMLIYMLVTLPWLVLIIVNYFLVLSCYDFVAKMRVLCSSFTFHSYLQLIL